jgi:competence CoiA-like predicted nuclease
MPLRALLENKDFFADNLNEENRKRIFQCPNCSSKLIAVLPKHKIKHFRHKKGVAHYEPETEEHFTGKHELLKIAEVLGYSAVTEYRIGDHITDVFVRTPQPIAIEYQCSKTTAEEIMNRSLTYKKHGVEPLWIFGTNLMEHPSRIMENSVAIYQKSVLYHCPDFPFYRRKAEFPPGQCWDDKDFAECSIEYEIKRVGKCRILATVDTETTDRKY